MNKIKALVQSPFYWLAVIAVGFGLEALHCFISMFLMSHLVIYASKLGYGRWSELSQLALGYLYAVSSI